MVKIKSFSSSINLGFVGLVVVLIDPSSIFSSQNGQNQPGATSGQPRIVHAHWTTDRITIDGHLDEAVWKQAVPAEGFKQTEPDDGSAATEPTQVWVAYDRNALYVAALCHDKSPKNIVARLGRHDDWFDSDWFLFEVDTYNDGRSAYRFGVTPAGSMFDSTLFNDVEEDKTWDGIWESNTLLREDGWSLEMKIPFNQLRFPKKEKDEYVWGVDFHRVIKRKSETDIFSWVSNKEGGHVSHFARLEGIKGIVPGCHVEILPYAVGDIELQPAGESDPLQTRPTYNGNAGCDLKVGILGNLTLDATVNPDFGQVEVDPAVINLSAYEIYHQEKRPFFIEGASIFNGFGQGGLGGDKLKIDPNSPQPQFFYSRRIGQPPPDAVRQSSDVDFPDRTAILGAAKVTGRLGDWNIGVLSALTTREDATSDDLGIRSERQVEPLSWYSVFRAQKDIKRGYQGYGFIATGVERRDLRADSPLNGFFNKNALSLGLDGWSFLNENRDWVVGGWVGGTRIGGTAEDISRVQTSPLHYFQRPDAYHVKVDLNATTLSGWGMGFSLIKQGGSSEPDKGNFLFSLNLSALSPGFDSSDIGFQKSTSDVLGFPKSSSDVLNVTCLGGYYWDKAWSIFKRTTIGVGPFLSYDFDGNKIGEGLIAMITGPLRNSWDFTAAAKIMPNTLDNQQTRGGPLMLSPAGGQAVFSLSTDGWRSVAFEGDLTFGDQPKNGYLCEAGLEADAWLRYNFAFSIRPTYKFLTTKAQWVKSSPDPLMTSTYGCRYVFALLRQHIVSAQIRFTWALTPKLSLQAYVEPFIGIDKYSQFKELARPKAFAFNIYGEDGSTITYADGNYTVDPDGGGPASSFPFKNPDGRPKSLSGTVVLRWEYLPGSLVYAVWTRNSIENTTPGNLPLGQDMDGQLTNPGKNTFLLKVTYSWNHL